MLKSPAMIKGKLVKYSFYGVGLVVVLGIATASHILHRSLPVYEGQVAMPHLGSDVRILRDEHGIPHIFANDMNDAARALGYAHASERMFQMEMQRRAGQGRLSEVVGSDTVKVDKFIRTLGLYGLAQSSYSVFSPDAKTYFQAYADGVNAWLESHPHNLPPEFSLLGITPEPWKPEDSVVWGKLMALELSHNYKLEILRAQLAQNLPPAMLHTLFPITNTPSPVTVAPRSTIAITPSTKPADKTVPHKVENGAPSDGVLPAAHMAADNSAWDELGKITSLGHAASNEWVIAGSRTVSGKPILANDPHLGLEAPILWYLARIVTPQFWLKGATVPGIPIVLLGQNDHIAWGFTTTNSDTQDLFIETVDPKNEANYLTPKGSVPFVTRDEIIHVKHGMDITLKVRSTRHGPVMSDIDNDMAKIAGSGKVMALSFMALGAQDTTSEALMHLNRARNWAEFTGALKLFQGPTQNMVYADKDGHIGFINPGLVPVRKKAEGEFPVDGASGTYDWLGQVPFTQVPQIYDPKVGFVFNANNEVINQELTAYIFSHDWDEPYRARRLQAFFDTLPKHSLDTSAAMQMDILSPEVADLLPYILRGKPTNDRARDAIEMLRTWDRRMAADSPAALIFESWMYQLHKEMLVAKSGNDLTEKGPYSATALNAILESNDPLWCGLDGCSKIVMTALDDELDMLTKRHGSDMKSWRWGDEHITVLQNKVFAHVPFMKGVSDLSVSSDGGYYTLNRGESADVDPDQPFARRHGGGYRGIYDLGDPDQSRFMIVTGESGHPLSPHYGDLVPLWNSGQYVTLAGTADELKAKGYTEMVLTPAR